MNLTTEQLPDTTIERVCHPRLILSISRWTVLTIKQLPDNSGGTLGLWSAERLQVPSEIDLEDISKTDVDYASCRMAQGRLLRSRPLRAHCQVISLMSYLS
jgi:hypothetical protein